MNRRGYLRTLGATTAATAGLAGCLGDGNPNTTLGKPEREHNMTSKQLPYLAWGERIPSVSIEDPLTGQTISIRDDVKTPSLFTFIFTHCMDGVCPALVGALSNVQTHSVTNDYADEVTFLPITFDPARDDAEALRSFAKEMHVNLSVGNWHSLHLFIYLFLCFLLFVAVSHSLHFAFCVFALHRSTCSRLCISYKLLVEPTDLIRFRVTVSGKLTS